MGEGLMVMNAVNRPHVFHKPAALLRRAAVVCGDPGILDPGCGLLVPQAATGCTSKCNGCGQHCQACVVLGLTGPESPTEPAWQQAVLCSCSYIDEFAVSETCSSCPEA